MWNLGVQFRCHCGTYSLVRPTPQRCDAPDLELSRVLFFALGKMECEAEGPGKMHAGLREKQVVSGASRFRGFDIMLCPHDQPFVLLVSSIIWKNTRASLGLC